MSKQIFKVDETESLLRLDSYLSCVFDNYSRTKLQEYIKLGKVLVNGDVRKPSFVLHTDDEIVCDFDEFEELKVNPEPIDIEVVWEDEYYAVINKPSGMLTHPTAKEKEHTLVNALVYKYKDDLSDVNGEYRRGIVHRLDRNTSGLLIIAKKNDAHEKIAGMIKDRLIEKRYRAIVKGRIENDIIIDEPIGRNKQNPSKMCVTPDGKPSLTEVSVIELFDSATYLDVNLKTGRTHQIRVHLSHIGHPVYNDTLYGFGKMKIKTDEQVLQSYKLKFQHPFKNITVEVEIEPDDKIKRVLNYLKNK